MQASDRLPLSSKYRALLDDERVRKWFDYVARGAAVTAETYFRRLGMVCGSMGIIPSELPGRDEVWLWNFFNDLV